MMRVRLRQFVAAACVIVLAGCDLKGETGFVEIRRTSQSVAASDVLLLNDDRLGSFGTKDQMLVEHASGTVKLRARRGQTEQDLCEFAIRKNRVVTATLTEINRNLRCAVQS